MPLNKETNQSTVIAYFEILKNIYLRGKTPQIFVFLPKKFFLNYTM